MTMILRYLNNHILICKYLAQINILLDYNNIMQMQNNNNKTTKHKVNSNNNQNTSNISLSHNNSSSKIYQTLRYETQACPASHIFKNWWTKNSVRKEQQKQQKNKEISYVNNKTECQTEVPRPSKTVKKLQETKKLGSQSQKILLRKNINQRNLLCRSNNWKDNIIKTPVFNNVSQELKKFIIRIQAIVQTKFKKQLKYAMAMIKQQLLRCETSESQIYSLNNIQKKYYDYVIVQKLIIGMDSFIRLKQRNLMIYSFTQIAYQYKIAQQKAFKVKNNRLIKQYFTQWKKYLIIKYYQQNKSINLQKMREKNINLDKSYNNHLTTRSITHINLSQQSQNRQLSSKKRKKVFKKIMLTDDQQDLQFQNINYRKQAKTFRNNKSNLGDNLTTRQRLTYYQNLNNMSFQNKKLNNSNCCNMKNGQFLTYMPSILQNSQIQLIPIIINNKNFIKRNQKCQNCMGVSIRQLKNKSQSSLQTKEYFQGKKSRGMNKNRKNEQDEEKMYLRQRLDKLQKQLLMLNKRQKQRDKTLKLQQKQQNNNEKSIKSFNFNKNQGSQQQQNSLQIQNKKSLNSQIYNTNAYQRKDHYEQFSSSTLQINNKSTKNLDPQFNHHKFKKHNHQQKIAQLDKNKYPIIYQQSSKQNKSSDSFQIYNHSKQILPLKKTQIYPSTIITTTTTSVIMPRIYNNSNVATYITTTTLNPIMNNEIKKVENILVQKPKNQNIGNLIPQTIHKSPGISHINSNIKQNKKIEKGWILIKSDQKKYGNSLSNEMNKTSNEYNSCQNSYVRKYQTNFDKNVYEDNLKNIRNKNEKQFQTANAFMKAHKSSNYSTIRKNDNFSEMNNMNCISNRLKNQRDCIQNYECVSSNYCSGRMGQRQYDTKMKEYKQNIIYDKGNMTQNGSVSNSRFLKVTLKDKNNRNSEKDKK